MSPLRLRSLAGSEENRYALDYRRARGLGWELGMGFDKGMRATIEWCQNRSNYRGLPTDAIPH